MHNEDADLIAACQSGDLSAFERLVNRYQDRVIRVLYLLLGDADDAQDVGQETFLRAYRYIGSFRGRSSIATWLHRIAINTAHNWIRDNRRNIELATAPEELRQVERTRPEDLLLERERQLEIKSALKELPQHYREAIVLRYFDDLSYEEIAEIQQVPIGTVRSRLAKGRDLLSRSLAPSRGSTVADERGVCHELQTGEKNDPLRGGGRLG